MNGGTTGGGSSSQEINGGAGQRIKTLCVFCGSSVGKNPRYEEDARELGKRLVERGISLVYGGGNTGLMQAVAGTVRDAGGEVIGIIPHALARTFVCLSGYPCG